MRVTLEPNEERQEFLVHQIVIEIGEQRFDIRDDNGRLDITGWVGLVVKPLAANHVSIGQDF